MALQSSAMPRPRFIYSFAASLDGFVADPKGGVEWLNAFGDADYGLEELFNSMDAIVMGRKTYEVALKLGGMPSMGSMRVIVLSKTLKPAKHKKIEIWSKSIAALATDLEKNGAKRVWVMGGGVTSSSFLDAGLLDEVEISTMPVVLGKGIPMFGKAHKAVRFGLMSSRQFDNGVIVRSYELKESAAPKTKARRAKK